MSISPDSSQSQYRNQRPASPPSNASTSNLDRLQLRIEIEGAHAVHYRVAKTPERQVLEEAFTCKVHVNGGPPFKGYGATEEDAKNEVAGLILDALAHSQIIFNSKKALEHQSNHADKYNNLKKKKGEKKK